MNSAELKGCHPRRGGFNILTNIKFQTKIILFCSIVILLVLISFVVYLRHNIFSNIKDEITGNHLQLSIKILESVDTHIETIDGISKKIISNKELLNTLDKINSSPTHPTNKEKLVYNRELSNITFDAVSLTSFPLLNVYIYSKNQQYAFAYNQNESNMTHIMKDPYSINQLYQRKLTIYPVNDHSTGYNDMNSISYVRLIFDVDAKMYGYVEIQGDDADIKRMVDIGDAGDVFIMNANQRIVYSTKPIDTSTREALVHNNHDQARGIFKDNSGNIYFYSTSDYSGLTLFIKYDPVVLYSSLSLLEKATYVVVGIISLASLLLILVFSKLLVAPLRDLRDSILRVNYKNMGVQINPTNNNEIKMLRQAFQDILNKLKMSVEKEIASNKAETRARMTALQAQIEPHFIHNVLYTVSIAAMEQRTDDVQSMCEQLSDMMRYTVNSGFQLVRLEEEMSYIVNYLSLQSKKYEDFLFYEIYIDEQTKDVLLPRLSIQPFVENAMKHAFNDLRPPYRISIIGEMKKGSWTMSIIDNGNGIERGIIDEIYRRVGENEFSSGYLMEEKSGSEGVLGVGIINSVLRFKMIYGSSFRFSIENNSDRGTKVCLGGNVDDQLHLMNLGAGEYV